MIFVFVFACLPAVVMRNRDATSCVDSEFGVSDLAVPHSQPRQQRCYAPARYVLVSMSIVTFSCIWATRKCINVAIIAMVESSDTLPSASASVAGNNTSKMAEFNNISHLIGETMGTTTIIVSDDSSPHTYDWSPFQQTFLLSAIYLGLFSTQILGGVMAQRFGPKLMQGQGLLMSSLLTLLTPIAADLSYPLLVASRVTLGVAQGLSQPSLVTMWGHWAPASERSKLMAVSIIGCPLGVFIGKVGTAYICDSPFLGGWPAVFYIYGGIGLFVSVLWFSLTYDTPALHPRISREELDYISRTSAACQVTKCNDSHSCNQLSAPSPPQPQRRLSWCLAIRSPAVLAIMVAQFSSSWADFAMPIALPSFMHEVLHFNITQNGFYSSLPFLMLVITNPISGVLADRLISRGTLSTKNTRKLVTSMGLFVPGALILAVCVVENQVTTVALLTLALGMSGFTFAGCKINHLDIAPGSAGTLFGLTNTVAATAGFIGPAVLGGLKTAYRDSMTQWRIFFLVTAIVFFIGGIVFLIFAQGQPQKLEKGVGKEVLDLKTDKCDEYIRPLLQQPDYDSDFEK